MRGMALRWGLTMIILVAAGVSLYLRFQEYFHNPWTRDGIVSAEVVRIAPRVSGPITKVHVLNNQKVRTGDLLFEIQDDVYQTALRQAEANLEQRQALARQARDTATREQRLRGSDAISQQRVQDSADQLQAAEAAVREAKAALDTARLHLNFTRVVAPVDGYVANLNLQIGSMTAMGEPLLALIDSSTFRIDAFFRENLLADLRPGDPAHVTLMTYPDLILKGTVTSIGWGIARHNGSTGEDLLPNVTPTFEWIRLAQRVPVHIHLDALPSDVLLRMGTTASVLVESREGR